MRLTKFEFKLNVIDLLILNFVTNFFTLLSGDPVEHRAVREQPVGRQEQGGVGRHLGAAAHEGGGCASPGHAGQRQDLRGRHKPT